MKIYKCTPCGRTGRKDNIEQHIKSVHLGIRPACSRCGKTFANDSSLKRHSPVCKQNNQNLVNFVNNESGQKNIEMIEQLMVESQMIVPQGVQDVPMRGDTAILVNDFGQEPNVLPGSLALLEMTSDIGENSR